MGELLRSGVRGFPNSGGQRPPQMRTVWLLTRGAPRKLVGVWGVDVEVFSRVRFSAFAWYFTWWESCTLKCAIYILLIFSSNISIVLDQITIFKTSISAEVTVLSQSSKCALLSLFHLKSPNQVCLESKLDAGSGGHADLSKKMQFGLWGPRCTGWTRESAFQSFGFPAQLGATVLELCLWCPGRPPSSHPRCCVALHPSPGCQTSCLSKVSVPSVESSWLQVKLHLLHKHPPMPICTSGVVCFLGSSLPPRSWGSPDSVEPLWRSDVSHLRGKVL